MYPEFALINGEKYKINTDLLTAKCCFKTINDDTIDDYERTLGVIFLLFGFVPKKDIDLFLKKAVLFLQRGEETVADEEKTRDMDINLDESYITASFLGEYHIDLQKENMHYWQFVDLLNGLSDKCVLSRVRRIRNYDLSEIKDGAERDRMAKAQEALKLPEKLTAAEKKAADEFEALFE